MVEITSSEEEARLFRILGCFLDVEKKRNDISRDLHTWKSATYTQGVDVYPFHGTLILYNKGEGLPRFDVSKATEYFEGLVKNTIEIIKEILAKWESNIRR